MEMMHLSDDGLERLALKLAESGGRMTMMQKVYFKKGVAKIQSEID